MSRKENEKKQKSWNQGGKSRKNKFSAEEEQISRLLDQAEEEELLKISAIHSEVSMPLPNREKLAWSVIDKADLVDEEERRRREEFQKMLRRKKLIRAAAVCGTVLVFIFVLALCGVFDRFNPPTYESYYVLGGDCFSDGKAADPMKILQDESLPENVEVSVPALSSKINIDKDKLDTTVYSVLAKYCEANGYAVGEYEIAYALNADGILEAEPEYRQIDGKMYVICHVIGNCLDYSISDKGQTWDEVLEERVKWREEIFALRNIGWFYDYETNRNVSERIIETMEKPLDLTQPINMYSICLSLYVAID